MRLRCDRHQALSIHSGSESLFIIRQRPGDSAVPAISTLMRIVVKTICKLFLSVQWLSPKGEIYDYFLDRGF
jgi:hypothetical protein